MDNFAQVIFSIESLKKTPLPKLRELISVAKDVSEKGLNYEFSLNINGFFLSPYPESAKHLSSTKKERLLLILRGFHHNLGRLEPESNNNETLQEAIAFCSIWVSDWLSLIEKSIEQDEATKQVI